GAQGVGNIPIDVNGMRIDFMAFSGWKWLLGPLGIGALYISREKLQELKHVFKGTDSVINSEEYLPYKNDLKSGADRYEFSTANFNDWVYWKASLKMLKEIGWLNVMQQIYKLNHLLANSLRPLGFHLSTDEFQESSGILTAWHEKKPSSEIVRQLKKQGIITANRLGRVRFSPHIYISEEQIQRAREVLEKFLKE
ncbi:MAG: aminotransferase class V-fold PLP-dependent enzyme, partial [Leptospiraceae bacterium]|nr:aminotransferase class V-fold PLP-dependent enzyme [Leptospiraceae bacterium]